MKDRFPEFYNKLDFEELWNRCTFVFDTNILINLYGFPKEDYTQFLNILESISDRLWMPHQIGWEYQKNRYIGINKAVNSHNTLKSSVKDL
ncbi:MAG: PIN-like domain-containing protein, partial [Methanobacterium sp.]|nr:PIN-like domain-containing protein [Methanobacterium sp.]